MPRRRLIWQLYPSYLLITLLALFAVTVYATRSLHSFFLKDTRTNLEARGHLLTHEIEGLLEGGKRDSVDTLVKRLGFSSHTRITVILPTGLVIADSDKDPALMDNHSTRPEVQEALEGGVGGSTRYSATLHEKMMYVALPLVEDGKTVAVLRTSTPVNTIDQTLDVIYQRIGLAWLVITILAAWISWVNARRITAPLEKMRMGAQRIAEGDLSGHLPEEGSEEVGALAAAMNRMTAQLDDRIRTILRQRNEQEAVFSSISDGVLAVDGDGLLISMNTTAADLFGIEDGIVRGRTIQEMISIPDLRYFVAQALRTSGEVEDEIEIDDHGDRRFLQARGRPLRDEAGKNVGAVVVLHDVTRMRRLEKARRDFVANVSHELRTPVTSIKGFVETLRDGALENGEDARRFVDIIARQADRLDAIIEDLLSLARIERDAESQEIHLYESAIAPAVEGAVLSVSALAESKRITIETDCPTGLKAWINQPLLEQALVNLIGNAIKYSDPETRVTVHVEKGTKQIRIDVSDEGPGIEERHLPRLFERFYRVDKGRSRQVGGTGLGLAIVKHIALAHGGRVEVQSTVGKGSLFTLYLPSEHTPPPQPSQLQNA